MEAAQKPVACLPNAAESRQDPFPGRTFSANRWWKVAGLLSNCIQMFEAVLPSLLLLPRPHRQTPACGRDRQERSAASADLSFATSALATASRPRICLLPLCTGKGRGEIGHNRSVVLGVIFWEIHRTVCSLVASAETAPREIKGRNSKLLYSQSQWWTVETSSSL